MDERKPLRNKLIFLALAALIAVTGTALGQGTKTIEILPNGNVRFDDGPEINRDQLKGELKRIAALKPRPELSMKLPKQANFEAIAHVMNDMMDAGFRVGFVVGPAQPKSK